MAVGCRVQALSTRYWGGSSVAVGFSQTEPHYTRKWSGERVLQNKYMEHERIAGDKYSLWLGCGAPQRRLLISVSGSRVKAIGGSLSCELCPNM